MDSTTPTASTEAPDDWIAGGPDREAVDEAEAIADLSPEEERYLDESEGPVQPGLAVGEDGETLVDEGPAVAAARSAEALAPEPLSEAVAAMERGLVDAADLTEEEAGRPTDPGMSPVALAAPKQWDAVDRPKEWIGRVYGLVVHTTGGGLPAKARDNGVYHTIQAVDYYHRSHGCHYVNGWRGAAGGDLLQVANEREQANGVGVTYPKDPRLDQRRSIDAGRFEADLPPVLVRLWRQRWPGKDHSLQLLPGTRTANSCYVHVECVPCIYSYDKRWTSEVDPMRKGLRFTQAQHDTVAVLACDIARRNGWPAGERWWRTPRLLGHEDLTPITRHDRNGGWDPGWLREAPYFDWDYVYAVIERIVAGDPNAPALPPSSRAAPSVLSVLGTAVDAFRSMLLDRREAAAVELALDRGVRSVNDLTNLVFFGRHPEMEGRKIRPDETGLAREWLDIRRDVVTPVLDRRR